MQLSTTSTPIDPALAAMLGSFSSLAPAATATPVPAGLPSFDGFAQLLDSAGTNAAAPALAPAPDVISSAPENEHVGGGEPPVVARLSPPVTFPARLNRANASGGFEPTAPASSPSASNGAEAISTETGGVSTGRTIERVRSPRGAETKFRPAGLPVMTSQAEETVSATVVAAGATAFVAVPAPVVVAELGISEEQPKEEKAPGQREAEVVSEEALPSHALAFAPNRAAEIPLPRPMAMSVSTLAPRTGAEEHSRRSGSLSPMVASPLGAAPAGAASAPQNSPEVVTLGSPLPMADATRGFSLGDGTRTAPGFESDERSRMEAPAPTPAPIWRGAQALPVSTAATAVPMAPSSRFVTARTAQLESLPVSAASTAAPLQYSGAEMQQAAYPAFRHRATPREKNAGSAPADVTLFTSGESAGTKTFVSPDPKRVAKQETILGTGIAKSGDIMPAPAFSTLSAPASTEMVGPVLEVGVGREEIAAADASGGIPPELAAHRAVEAVLDTALRFAAGERQMVQLKFSVDGADLNVRVELRADEVHTTFSTDSAELQTALAHEWQHTTAAAPERPLRLATPVFTSGDFAGSMGDQSNSRQRDSAARRASAEFSVTGARATAGRATSFAAPSASPASAPTGTALHLHRLA